MTREEELDWLYRLRSEIYVYMPKEWIIPMENALDMAIKALEYDDAKYHEEHGEVIVDKAVWEDAVRAMQEPKTGHWIMNRLLERRTCDNCNTEYRWSFNPHNYCPNCGAKMVEEQERSE